MESLVVSSGEGVRRQAGSQARNEQCDRKDWVVKCFYVYVLLFCLILMEKEQEFYFVCFVAQNLTMLNTVFAGVLTEPL